MINVTKTSLPPLEDYIEYLKIIWQKNQLTNSGCLVLELESKLKDFLAAKHFFFVSNGTIALQIAIKSLDLKGEIITTPFSYVATTSSIVWENCQPVFADIEADTLTINPAEIEKLINEKTSAILATHVYGNPCAVEEISRISEKYKLKVIYDAAHCFGVSYKGTSLTNYGDISTLSFHATKIFQTAEGGGLTTSDNLLAEKLNYLRNFGHKGQDTDFWGVGINGKNSELHAAMGLCNLKMIKKSIAARKIISELYDELLAENPDLKKVKIREGTEYNFAYYPLIFPSEDALLKTKNKLNANKIFPRRYFYPSLNKLNYVESKPCPVSEDISGRILCLPLYDSLSEKEVQEISRIVLESK